MRSLYILPTGRSGNTTSYGRHQFDGLVLPVLSPRRISAGNRYFTNGLLPLSWGPQAVTMPVDE